jgi:hypothetical protein
MTRTLRRRHRIVTSTLACVLPLVFLAAMAARRVVPVNRDVPLQAFSSVETNLAKH